MIAPLLLAAALSAAASVLPISQMDPHRPKEKGPWCEGWYTRIVDPTNNRSLAIVTASYLPKDAGHRDGESMPGYLAVAVQEGIGTPLKVYETFPDRTSLFQAGKPVRRDPDMDSPANFAWDASGNGKATQDSLEIEIPGRIKVSARLGARKPWDDKDLGPQGIGAYLKFLPLNWFVHSLGSECSYEITYPSEGGASATITGQGYAHQEKNWGKLFPSAWIWLQSMSSDNTAHLALAGGRLDLRLMTPTAWMAGYRSEKVQAYFRPSVIGTTFTTVISACRGRFEMTAENPAYKLEISAQAPLDSFGLLSIPGPQGFYPGALESFSTEISAKLYDKRLRQEVESRTFLGGALEFGGDYRRCEEPTFRTPPHISENKLDSVKQQIEAFERMR